ncbi:MAG: ferritin [Anaerolineae bacterium]|nr:ferritin [Anaerolineae bacterium]
MQLSDKIQAAMNQQINAELHSAYIYLSMSAYFEDEGFSGMANWMRQQYEEEVVHALKFFDYINERRGRVILEPIAAVPNEWESPLAVFEAALGHEEKVSAMILAIMNLAVEEKDRASVSFLNWYVDEQVEEEASADAVVQKLKLAGNSPQALLFLDAELGQRVSFQVQDQA